MRFVWPIGYETGRTVFCLTVMLAGQTQHVFWVKINYLCEWYVAFFIVTCRFELLTPRPFWSSQVLSIRDACLASTLEFVSKVNKENDFTGGRLSTTRERTLENSNFWLINQTELHNKDFFLFFNQPINQFQSIGINMSRGCLSFSKRKIPTFFADCHQIRQFNFTESLCLIYKHVTFLRF